MDTARISPVDVFDVGEYVRTPAGPYTVKAVGQLNPNVTLLIRYLRDCFSDTAGWLAHVLVTPTHKDARATAFLSTWAYEQLWLADVMRSLLAEQGDVAPQRQRGSRAIYVGPLIEAVLANVYGQALTGAQMTSRLLDSLLLDALLAVVEQEVSGQAKAAMQHTREVLARQREFFEEYARRELGASKFARLLTRWRLRRPMPLGSTQTYSRFVFQVAATREPDLLADAVGMLRSLPGFEGTRLLEYRFG